MHCMNRMHRMHRTQCICCMHRNLIAAWGPNLAALWRHCSCSISSCRQTRKKQLGLSCFFECLLFVRLFVCLSAYHLSGSISVCLVSLVCSIRFACLCMCVFTCSFVCSFFLMCLLAFVLVCLMCLLALFGCLFNVITCFFCLSSSFLVSCTSSAPPAGSRPVNSCMHACVQLGTYLYS